MASHFLCFATVMKGAASWLLWDGDCGLCAAAARWVAQRDSAGRFMVVAWQRAPSPPLTEALAEACRHKVHVVRGNGEVLGGEAAILFVLAELGWTRLARWASTPPLSHLAGKAYRFIARHRRGIARLLGLPALCAPPGGSVHVKSGT